MLAYAGAGVALTEPLLLETLPIPGLVCRPLQPRIPLDLLLVHAKGLPQSQAMQHSSRACAGSSMSGPSRPGTAIGWHYRPGRFHDLTGRPPPRQA